MAMLGSPCSPCCCGPEIASLPTRFEVDVVAIDAQEKHWGMRYAKWFFKFTVGEFSTGYVQNWHAGAIESGTYSLDFVSNVGGVATYQHVSAGILLQAICTPSGDGRYAVFFVCVPARTTTQLWGLESGFGGRYAYQFWVDRRDIWAAKPPNFVPPAEPPDGPRPFAAIDTMRFDSAAITEAPSETGTVYGRKSRGPYTLKQACHAITIGTRLACPSVTIRANSFIETELVSVNTFLTNGNWPLQIRSKARIYIPWIEENWYFRGGSSPGRQVPWKHPGLGPFQPTAYGPEYDFNFGFSAISGLAYPDSDSGWLYILQDQESRDYDVYAWYSNFNRDIDITQIRAVFPDTTQQWG